MMLCSSFILLLMEVGFDLGGGETISLNDEMGECMGKTSRLLCD
jgi:hypothetical protein